MGEVEVVTQTQGRQIERDPARPIKITIADPDTGEILEEKTVSNDYVLICAGNRYVKSTQILGRTHMVAIAVRK